MYLVNHGTEFILMWFNLIYFKSYFKSYFGKFSYFSKILHIQSAGLLKATQNVIEQSKSIRHKIKIKKLYLKVIIKHYTKAILKSMRPNRTWPTSVYNFAYFLFFFKSIIFYFSLKAWKLNLLWMVFRTPSNKMLIDQERSRWRHLLVYKYRC